MRMWFVPPSLRRYRSCGLSSAEACARRIKRLLRLVDGLNLLTEEAAFSNYREGLRNGMRLACAVFASRQGTPGEGEG